jgi:CubicO group peptidase (beta-lactamase class C family)
MAASAMALQSRNLRNGISMKSPLIACALLAIATGASAAPPVDLAKFPDTAASDPKANALMVGTPPPPDKLVRWADGSHFRFPNTRWSFSHMREVMPTADVWRGSGKPSHFARAEQKLDTVAYTDMDGIARTWGEALAKTWTDGVVVVHRGRIVYEKYFGALEPHFPHIAMSVTKSFVGLLATMLEHEGKLDPSAPVTRYVPELAATAYGDATVRQVMDMTTGVQYSENYADPKAEIFGYMTAGAFLPAPPGAELPGSFFDFLKTLKKEGEHDQAFAYKTVNTEVLSWIVQRVSGQALPQLLAQRLWQKLGAEEDAYLLVDRTGTASGGGGLNATLRDMARVGEMMRLKGRFNGQQIVPAAVVADIAAGADQAKFAKAGYTTLPNWTYHNQWWISDQGYYMARGIYGQAIYVDPKSELVIARFGSHPIAANSVQDPIILPAYRAIAKHLNRGR